MEKTHVDGTRYLQTVENGLQDHGKMHVKYFSR